MKCTCKLRSPTRTASRTLSPAHKLIAPRTSHRHHTHKHKDKLEDGSDKAMSVSNYWDSHQYTKSETSTKEVEVRLRKPRYWGGPGQEYAAAWNRLWEEEPIICNPARPLAHTGQVNPREKEEGRGSEPALPTKAGEGPICPSNQPVKRPHPSRDLGEEKGPQRSRNGRLRHPRLQPRPKKAPHPTRTCTRQTSASPTHLEPCKRKGE